MSSLLVRIAAALPLRITLPQCARERSHMTGTMEHGRLGCVGQWSSRPLLSWNEIRHRAIAFAREWKGAASEKSQRQTFWNEFFEVFGIRRRLVATFEEPVRKLSGNWGYIDLFWPARVLVEHKSRGEDLGKASAHGMQSIRALASPARNMASTSPSARPRRQSS